MAYQTILAGTPKAFQEFERKPAFRKKRKDWVRQTGIKIAG
jgi:hypothetical protein